MPGTHGTVLVDEELASTTVDASHGNSHPHDTHNHGHHSDHSDEEQGEHVDDHDGHDGHGGNDGNEENDPHAAKKKKKKFEYRKVGVFIPTPVDKMKFVGRESRIVYDESLFKNMQMMQCVLITLILMTIACGAYLSVSNKNRKICEDDILQPFSVYNLCDKKNTSVCIHSKVDGKQIQQLLRRYALYPHNAGSDNNRKQARDQVKKFEAYGGSGATIQEIPVLLNDVEEQVVQLVDDEGSPIFTALLSEADFVDSLEQDVESELPPVFGYTAGGDVSGKLYYVNQGTLEDFNAIKDIDLNGAIVIVRSGGTFRATKVRLAEARGAAAILIFTNPELGAVNGEVYPKGMWANNSTVERGTVWDGYGDPLTPFWGSDGQAPTITLANAFEAPMQPQPLPKILAQPLSLADALPLLRAINGTGRPSPTAWRKGVIPMASLGGTATVRVKLSVSYDQKRILYNVHSVMKGSIEPDRVVVIGAHRDTWAYGAVDNTIGTAIVMEIARVLGTMWRSGWRPRRTLQFSLFDGEEWGYLGSTEFVQGRAALLKRDLVAYINVDMPLGIGTFIDVVLDGSPSLQDLFLEELGKVTLNGEPLSKRWVGVHPSLAYRMDTTAFIHELGVATMTVFTAPSKADEALYHSNSDTVRYYETFVDPGYEKAAIFARVVGAAVSRIVEQPILPMNVHRYAVYIKGQFEANQKLYKGNTSSLELAIARLMSAATLLEETRSATALLSVYGYNQNLLRSINDRVMYFERSLALSATVLYGNATMNRHLIFHPDPRDLDETRIFLGLEMSQTADEAEFYSNLYAGILDSIADGLYEDRL